MKPAQHTFSLPMPMKQIHNRRSYHRNNGNLTIRFEGQIDGEIKVYSVEFNDINILPVLEYEYSKGECPLLDEIEAAAVAHLEYVSSEERIVELENEESNF